MRDISARIIVMIERVISGGQTGADQAAWRAAKQLGFRTGGWMPRGFLTEAGPRPEFSEMYGAVETESAEYQHRTEANAREANCTLWFGDPNSRGGRATLKAVERFGTGVCRITPGDGCRPSVTADYLWRNSWIKVLNIAGNRESHSPGIGVRVERYLLAVFRRLQALEGITPPGPIGNDWRNEPPPY
jgi:hypothetical protein